jgi:glycosyltransferase involved in cell wall biosynthesis
VSPDELLVVHPVRAIPRKAVGRAVAIAEDLGATYWLLGPAEDGYGPELARELAAARCPVIHAPLADRADLYAAADVVAFPSTWEGFGNPPVEASLALRPVVVGGYPVAHELRDLGFSWFDADDLDPLRAWLGSPPDQREALLAAERAVAVRELSLERMSDRLESLLSTAGWLP